MALNLVYPGTPLKNRERALSLITNPSTPPTTIQPGVPVTFAEGPAVSLTASGNGTVTDTTNLPGELTSITYKNGGVGNLSGSATFAFDGTYEFSGVVSSGTTPAPTTTAQGVQVYIIPATGALTLASSGNVAYGKVDYPPDYHKVAGTLPVQIGA